MTDPNTHIAAALKTLRTEKGWSLDRTSKETGVSKAMLGQIERGESSPTVATLWKIATGFRTSFSGLLEPVPTDPLQTVVRDAASLRQDPSGGGMAVAALFPYEARFGFEQFELVFAPGFERLSEPHEPGLVETLTVISGILDIRVGEEHHRLTAGHSIRFGGDRTHFYHNPGTVPCTALCLIHYPSVPDAASDGTGEKVT